MKLWTFLSLKSLKWPIARSKNGKTWITQISRFSVKWPLACLFIFDIIFKLEKTGKTWITQIYRISVKCPLACLFIFDRIFKLRIFSVKWPIVRLKKTGKFKLILKHWIPQFFCEMTNSTFEKGGKFKLIFYL